MTSASTPALDARALHQMDGAGGALGRTIVASFGILSHCWYNTDRMTCKTTGRLATSTLFAAGTTAGGFK
jgi:hypothetical protein